MMDREQIENLVSECQRVVQWGTAPTVKGDFPQHYADRLRAALNDVEGQEHLRELKQYTNFGKAFWGTVVAIGQEFCGDEWSEIVLPLAQDAGLCQRVKYDPDIHGEIEEAEPSSEIWWWGKSRKGAGE